SWGPSTTALRASTQDDTGRQGGVHLALCFARPIAGDISDAINTSLEVVLSGCPVRAGHDVQDAYALVRSIQVFLCRCEHSPALLRWTRSQGCPPSKEDFLFCSDWDLQSC